MQAGAPRPGHPARPPPGNRPSPGRGGGRGGAPRGHAGRPRPAVPTPGTPPQGVPQRQAPQGPPDDLPKRKPPRPPRQTPPAAPSEAHAAAAPATPAPTPPTTGSQPTQRRGAAGRGRGSALARSGSRNDNRCLPSPPVAHRPVTNIASAGPSRAEGMKGGQPQLPLRRSAIEREQGIVRPAKKEEPRGLFPVKICLPHDKQTVLRCGKETPAPEFCKTAATKLKYFAAGESFELRSEDGDAFPDGIPLYRTAYIQACQEQRTVPVLRLCSLEARGQVTSGYVDEAEIARLVNEFAVQFLLPNGQNMIDNVQASQTVGLTLKFACRRAQERLEILLLDASMYEFHTYDGDVLLEDLGEVLSEIPYIRDCRKHCTTPKLVLVQKYIDPFTRAEAKKAKMVQTLIGKPIITTSSNEGEISDFRRTMARLRYLERKRKTEVGGGRAQRCMSVRVAESSGANREKLMATVTFPMFKQKNTIIIMPHETANLLMARVFEKYLQKKMPGKTVGDFVLKVAGLKEFIYGDHLVTSFEYVLKKAAKKEKVDLVVVDSKEVELKEDESHQYEEEWQKGGEEMLEACKVCYLSDVVTADVPWDQKTHISMWELERRFRVKLAGVEHLSHYYRCFGRIQDGGYSLYVRAGLYHGGEPLCPVQTTRTVPASGSPRWQQWLTFEIKGCDIPAATRLCFTLFATKGAANPKKDLAVAWVNCQLIDFKHELRQGLISLNMWADEEANPIGTCVQNSVLNASALLIALDEYQLPVVFPTADPSTAGAVTEVLPTLGAEGFHMLKLLEKVDLLVQKDPLFPLTAEQRRMLWKQRKYCSTKAKSLPKFLMSVPYNNRHCVADMHRLLRIWEPINCFDALELLDSRFPDVQVREYAVRCLAMLSDTDLQLYMLQLVQVLKYEPYHDSALARFLLRRGLRSKRTGHVLFWHLKAEMHVAEIAERYGLLLEAYLHGCGAHLPELVKQNTIMASLTTVANFIKTVPSSERREVLISKLRKVTLPPRFQLPLDPTWEAKGLYHEKCKYMDSKKLPLWLVFKNADDVGKPMVVIFKAGDDLRQDMLTLQIIGIMDKMWKSADLDLQLSPYGCISTGDEVGMIEVVLNSNTTAAITREAGGAAATLKKSPIADWLREHNPGDREYEAAQELFIKSCAGYCVATYVLGIGDRHNDNIMVQKSGRLFHIDFGHFLGNFKKKFGIQRERAKFVLTPDFAYVMGGVGSATFDHFVQLCCQAFNVLRLHASKLINLFAMMLSTGIPELTKASDIDYLRDALRLDLDEAAAAESFVKQISSSLDCKTTMVNNFIHILAH